MNEPTDQAKATGEPSEARAPSSASPRRRGPSDEPPETRASSTASPKRRRPVDPVALVGGLLLVAVGAVVLADRFWTDLDPAVMIGAVLAAAGVALVITVALRGIARRKREREPQDPEQQDQEQEQRDPEQQDQEQEQQDPEQQDQAR